nr:hypothetical protein [Tanacetum cinerariifolium]
FLDKRLNELMMMVLVRQTENCDMLLHMVMTDMKLLVVEIETADITTDDVDKVSCLTDVERSKQVDLNMKIPHKLDISYELAPFRRECVEKLLHMVMTDMKLLVVEIETADITTDDVDKVSCLTDVERSKQVDLKFTHLSIELHLHDIHVDQDKHEVDRR